MASLTLEENPFSRPKIYLQSATGKKWTKNIATVALKKLSRNLIYTSQYQFLCISRSWTSVFYININEGISPWRRLGSAEISIQEFYKL